MTFFFYLIHNDFWKKHKKTYNSQKPNFPYTNLCGGLMRRTYLPPPSKKTWVFVLCLVSQTKSDFAAKTWPSSLKSTKRLWRRDVLEDRQRHFCLRVGEPARQCASQGCKRSRGKSQVFLEGGGLLTSCYGNLLGRTYVSTSSHQQTNHQQTTKKPRTSNKEAINRQQRSHQQTTK